MPAKKKTVTAEVTAEEITAVPAAEEVKPAKKTRKTAKKAETAEAAVEEKPAKKTRKTAKKAETAEAAVEEKPVKKTRKTTKKAETAEAAVEEKPVKKTRKTTKKAETAETAAEEKPAKKTRKTAKKAAAVEETAAPAADLRTVQDYEDVINWKKGEAHASDWLYIEINAQDLLTEVEAGADNMATVCTAMMNTMLEGDGFLSAEEDKNTAAMTVRYYTDNLSADRKKYFEA